MTGPPGDAGERRAAVLNAVRGALADVPSTEGVDEPVWRRYVQDRSFEDPVGRFRSRLGDIGVEVTVCRAQDVPAAISAALVGRGEGPVVCATELPDEWRCHEPPLQSDDGTSTAAVLAQYSAGVTGAVAAIAETGTLVLDGGGLSGRRLISLVPDRHVCVIRSEDIVADVPQALAVLERQRPITFVSGPSATVDIELVRTQGVHGPRSLHVVVVEPTRS